MTEFRTARMDFYAKKARLPMEQEAADDLPRELIALGFLVPKD